VLEMVHSAVIVVMIIGDSVGSHARCWYHRRKSSCWRPSHYKSLLSHYSPLLLHSFSLLHFVFNIQPLQIWRFDASCFLLLRSSSKKSSHRHVVGQRPKEGRIGGHLLRRGPVVLVGIKKALHQCAGAGLLRPLVVHKVSSRNLNLFGRSHHKLVECGTFLENNISKSHHHAIAVKARQLPK
jgi:hypothetical protein